MEINKENIARYSNHKFEKITVCIPAFNGAKTIREVIDKSKIYAHEVIVCDDGSLDNTNSISKESGAIVIEHTRNRGYGKAIRDLFQMALERQADIVVSLDSDGQHDPAQIPKILKPIIEEGFDIVIGSRFLNEDDKSKVPFYRSIGIKTINILSKRGSLKNITDAQNGFRAYSRHALQSLNLIEDGMSISTEILFEAESKNLTIAEVPITVNYDVGNPSTHNFFSHGIALILNTLQFISFRHPLIFYGIPGLVLLVISAYFSYDALTIFSNTRYISINMLLLSTSAAIVAMVLLTTASILFSIASMRSKRTKLSTLSRTLQFISIRHPLIFFGLPGVGLLIVSGILGYIALDLFSTSRYVTYHLTNLLFVAAGAAVIGTVMLGTGIIQFSVSALLKGKIT